MPAGLQGLLDAESDVPYHHEKKCFGVSGLSVSGHTNRTDFTIERTGCAEIAKGAIEYIMSKS